MGIMHSTATPPPPDMEHDPEMKAVFDDMIDRCPALAALSEHTGTLACMAAIDGMDVATMQNIAKEADADFKTMAETEIEAFVGGVSAMCDILNHSKTLLELGQHYKNYNFVAVSWDDCARGHAANGELGFWGPNITDTWLESRQGKRFFTLRASNWTERLGRVRAKDITLQTSKGDDAGNTPEVATLDEVLSTIGEHGAKLGLDAATDLSSPALDGEVSIRFQAVFIPAPAGTPPPEFVPKAYNLNTRSNDNPCNMILVATSQGMAMYQDKRGVQELFHQSGAGDGDAVEKHWYEAVFTGHGVGGGQRESAAEKAAAVAQGRATAKCLGIEAMGKRFNVVMTIQVPLERLVGHAYYHNDELEDQNEMLDDDLIEDQCEMLNCVELEEQSATLSAVSTAARLSRGTHAGYEPNLPVSHPRRHETQRCTATVVVYYLVDGSVPSETDVLAAVDDLEQLYKTCEWNGTRDEAAAAAFNSESK